MGIKTKVLKTSFRWKGILHTKAHSIDPSLFRPANGPRHHHVYDCGTTAEVRCVKDLPEAYKRGVG